MKSNKDELRWREFLKLCQRASNENKLTTLMNFFLTREERVDIGKRLEIVRELLSEDLSQRSIANKVGVSISKVTRGSEWLKRVSKTFHDFMK